MPENLHTTFRLIIMETYSVLYPHFKERLFWLDLSTRIGDCTHDDVRLMNGSNVLEGRVEICINNAWGTVCTDSISEDDVEVICRQIGQLPPGMLNLLN